jgi:hypothetical protein
MGAAAFADSLQWRQKVGDGRPADKVQDARLADGHRVNARQVGYRMNDLRTRKSGQDGIEQPSPFWDGQDVRQRRAPPIR